MTRTLGSLAHSLANLFLDRPQTQEYQFHQGHPQDEPEYLLLAQGRGQPRHRAHDQAPAQTHESHPPDGNPTRQDVFNYLGDLAKHYHLPPKLVYSVADAESSVNSSVEPHPNYLRDRHHHVVHDRQGNPVISSWDYGLMQVNSGNIGKTVKDAHGHPFTIGEDAKTDWRANARAGVALLAPAYRLAELEQGPGATEEDHAQQAYSQYNGGSPKTRDRYLQEKHGLPENGADRNFLKKYRESPDKKR